MLWHVVVVDDGDQSGSLVSVFRDQWFSDSLLRKSDAILE